MKVKVQDNYIYKWTKKNNIYSIGYIWHKDKILKDRELVDFFNESKTQTEILEKITKVDGRFTIIIEHLDQVFIISDMLRSFPVFYKIEDNELIISNNIDEFKNKELNKTNIKELLSAGYVTGKETLYKDVYQNEASKIVIINKKDFNIIEEKYFVFKEKNKISDENTQEIFKHLDEIYNGATKRLIKYANGRKIIIPLSRGTRFKNHCILFEEK